MRRWRVSIIGRLLEIALKETPVGVEPTSTGLQPVAVPSGSSVDEYPRQELNLVYDLRTVACDPAHSEETLSVFSTPIAPRQGVEPRLAVPKTAVLSITLARYQYPAWIRTRIWTFGGSGTAAKRWLQFTTPSGQRADDWICTSIVRFTRPAPCYVEPRRQC